MLFLPLSKMTFSQVNLVPNGSFEEYNWCPNTIDGYYIDACKYWKAPTLGTSDYFNTCSSESSPSSGELLFSVPSNYIGYQFPKTGNAYAGFAYTESSDTSFVGNSSYSEYIRVQLNNTLEKGKLYKLRFYISNVDSTRCGNSIGAYFTSEDLFVSNDNNLEVIPDYQSDLSVFFCDYLNWIEQEYLFISNGTEQFLTIGVFTRLYESKTSDYFGNIISGPNQYGALQYLYIDDVSIEECDLLVPNVFTPNNDGVNDEFKINGLSNRFSVAIINRWGEKVFQTDKPAIEYWDGNSKMNNCSEGVYYYVIGDKKNDFKKTGFVQLIR